MKPRGLIAITAILTLCSACGDSLTPSASAKDADSIRVRERPVRIDSVPEADRASRYEKLTDTDFRMVAAELGVEVAAIKAVVSIEAGSAMKGFWAPGVPVINFDRAMYNRFRAKATDKRGAKGEKVPPGLTGYALSEWTQLINARKINAQGANMGTFW